MGKHNIAKGIAVVISQDVLQVKTMYGQQI